MIVLIGRALQLIGMVLLPAGLMIGLFRNNIAMEVRLLFIGGAAFVLGWLLSRRKE
jgi:hypothetical protein